MKSSKLVSGLMMAAVAVMSGCAGDPMRNAAMPHLAADAKAGGMTKLMVDGRPFICVAGEVANTSSSDVETMKGTIARLAKANLNTILTVVSWDLVEPTEGKFDFSMVDYQIQAARENHVRLIVLWMGSWKNGLSHFPPEWVKADQGRFPRVVNAAGNPLEILSTLSQASRDADARAFAAVMRHIREVDGDHTVIGVQVENEVGVLGSTRDFGAAANAAFAGPVPAELMNYLARNKERLNPNLQKTWMAAGGKSAGTWEEVFGKNVPRTDAPVPNSPNRTARGADAELFNHTDEIFMAWNYAQYIGAVAAAGKREYALPMYVNAWIVQPNDLGPGDYPSGGPEPFVHDVWRAGAPAIDILAPDIYLPQYAQVIQAFATHGNPAFNPETRQNSETAWTAFTELNALCYSPFGIDGLNPESGFARTYGFLNSISGALAEAQGQAGAIKLIRPTAGAPGKVEMGNYTFEFMNPPPRRGGGAAAPATAPATRPGDVAALSFLDAPFVLIVRTAPDEFYFATNQAYTFRTSAVVPGEKITAPATIDRGRFANGLWSTSHRLNGDDLMGLGYDLSGAAANGQPGTAVPMGPSRDEALRGSAGPTVLRVRFYHYH